MNIALLQDYIDAFEREVIDSGFKRDLDDYASSLPASQSNIVALRDIAEKVLSVSPTFLNLLAVSGEYAHHDLSSLKVVTFGSEPMSESVLRRTREVFPDCRLVQKLLTGRHRRRSGRVPALPHRTGAGRYRSPRCQ